MALCADVILLAPDERRALRQALGAAEADRFARVQSNRFSLSPEELPFLGDGDTGTGIDVLVQEGDGERTWSTLEEFRESRPEGELPPAVLEDQRGDDPERAFDGPVVTPAQKAAEAAVQGVKMLFALPYFALCAVVPLGAYPFLLPSMLRTGDLAAAVFVLGLIAAIGLLPLALVWQKLGPRFRALVFGAHAMGLLVGVVRYALDRG